MNPSSRASSTCRAMAWCEANGLAESALHYAHEAGETDAVTRLIEQLIMPAWYSGGVATLESWLELVRRR